MVDVVAAMIEKGKPSTKDIEDTILTVEAKMTKQELEQQVKDGANLYEANMSEANLCGANLSRANMSRANLARANLYEAILSRANLSEAILSGANLSRANLSMADLSGAILSGANLFMADLSGAKLNNGSIILKDASVISIGYIGSRKDTLFLFATNEGIFVKAGCWGGTEEQFRARLDEVYPEGKYREEYLIALECGKKILPEE